MEEHFAYKHIIENKSFLHKELLFKLNEDLEVKEVLEVIEEEESVVLEVIEEDLEVLEEKNEIIQEEVKEEDLEVKEVLEVIEVIEVIEEKNEIIEEYIWCLHIDCLCKLDYFSNIIELEKHMLEEH
jgi:hypothetical protein